MILKGTTKVDVEIDAYQIASFLEVTAWEMAGKPDDGGTDWYTDNNGNTYFGGDWSWKISSDPKVATLIDAAHILTSGEPLKMDTETPCTATI